MASIQPRKKPVIQKGEGYAYSPDTFAEHVQPMFHEVTTAQEILDNIKPLEFIGRRFVSFDTETHPYYRNSHQVPKGVVRRWVGTGAKAVPQDYPFSFQICDGTNAYCLYSTYEEGFKQLRLLSPIFEDPTIEFVAHNTN